LKKTGENANASSNGNFSDYLKIGSATTSVAVKINTVAQWNEILNLRLNVYGPFFTDSPVLTAPGSELALLQNTGKVLGGVGVGISAIQLAYNGPNTGNLLNVAAGLTFFVAPPVGPIISGVYGAVNLGSKIFTGYDLRQHVDNLNW